MGIFVLLSLANPMTWLIATMMIVTWSRISRRANNKEDDASRIVRMGVSSPEGVGAAFQFLSIAYRPNHAFTAKAQIVQHEDVDDDDEGGPDTPQKHLHRQLRRIRRGEALDRLVWRLEGREKPPNPAYLAGALAPPASTHGIYTGRRRLLCFSIRH